MKWDKFFDKPLVRTKIVSAEVTVSERLLGYFIGPFLALISGSTFGGFLNRYYSDVLGWTDTEQFGMFSTFLPVVSVIFLVIGNILVGKLMERVRTSQGKARPLLLFSAPLLTVAIIALFITPENSSPVVQMIWIAVSYNLYYAVAYPFYFTAHSALVTLSTRNSDE